jgi:DNA uptake protein ComE-like DNA-binding protein
MPKTSRIVRWTRLGALLAAVALTFGPTLAATASTADAAKTAKPPTTAAAPKVDINAATKAELDKLPGIGEAYSQKIIEGRPYKSKAELESRKILPKGVYDKIAPLIIAHQK